MPKRLLSTYWIGKKPSDGKRWSGTSAAAVLDDPALTEAVFHMHRRYVKQWNDIELNPRRELSEHTHAVLGAKVVGASRKFILAAHAGDGEGWILEVRFARSFNSYYPGLSCALNPLRTMDDIQSIRLYWSECGDEAFRKWLQQEELLNASNGEWTEYKKRA